MDLTRSGQFQIITDPAPRGSLSHQSPDYPTFRIISDFRINLLNQPFESTFWINLRNQPSHRIGGGTSLWYVASSKTYVRKIVFLLIEVRMIQVVDLLADHPLIEACSVPPSSTPWWRCGWKPCWTQLGLLPCADVSFVFRKVRVSDENDEGLLGIDQWPLGLTKYVGLDLTWSDAETSAGARLESWGVSGWYECIRMM